MERKNVFKQHEIQYAQKKLLLSIGILGIQSANFVSKKQTSLSYGQGQRQRQREKPDAVSTSLATIFVEVSSVLVAAT